MSIYNTNSKLSTLKHNLHPLMSVVVVIAMIYGCASVNKGETYSSKLSASKATYSKTEHDSSGNLLVLIRFPAVFTDKGFEVFQSRYAAFPLNLSGQKEPIFAARNKSHLYANEAINKTAYFALEFYHGLTRKLPPQSVILQPLEVTVDSMGRLVSEPVNEYPPSVLVVDFFIYRAPVKDVTKEVPLTFGDLVSPLITINTSPEASPDTSGAISYVAPLAPQNRNYVSNPRASGGTGHAFIEYLAHPVSTEKPGFATTSRQPRAKHQVLRFPLVNLKMNGYAIEAQVNKSNGNLKQSPFLMAVDAHFNAVIDALNTVDHGLATRNGNQRFIALYDPELFNRCLSSDLSGEDQLRLHLINKFKLLEQKFLAKQSEEYFKRLCLGEYGKSARKLMASEVKYVTRVRQNTSEVSGSKFKKNTILMMNLAANFMAGLSGRTLDNSSNMKTRDFMKTQDDMIASYEKENRELSEAFQNNFSDTYLKQTEYRTVALEGEKEIHAKSLSELRGKLLAFYNQKTKGMQRHFSTTSSLNPD